MKWMQLFGLKAIALLASIVAPSLGTAGGTATWPTYERVMVPPTPKAIADFELTDQDGRRFKFSSLQGKPALVMFGFVNCPDICPLSLQKLKTFKQSADDLRPVQILMISVDGERDTAATMKEFLTHFSTEFIGLTGDPQHVRAIATRFSAAFFKGQPQATGGYVVSHSGQLYAIDKSGQLRAEFYDASLEAMQGVMRALLKE